MLGLQSLDTYRVLPPAPVNHVLAGEMGKVAIHKTLTHKFTQEIKYQREFEPAATNEVSVKGIPT